MSSPHVVTLGTAGGPRWWDRPGAAAARSGIGTAVVVGDAVYLVDAGQGTGRQLARAGLPLDRVRALFLTHLHSDHVADLVPLVLFGLFERRDPAAAPIEVHGPGSRGGLPPLSPHATEQPEPVAAANPTPGTAQMIDLLCAAHASDLNDRIFDSLTRRPADGMAVHDIALPPGTGFDPDTRVAPPMEPFEVHRDDDVVVTAILVEHPPTAPAFAFRFDTAEGSVTISGDTAPCANVVRLARDTDLLLHEAIDLAAMGRRYGDGAMREATMAHHRRAHTTAHQAGELATEAGARALALHHLVPGDAPATAFSAAAAETFHGPLSVPDDLDVIAFATRTARRRTVVAR
jgi:ribonuclease BN (tRNA processing enzyme)